MTVDKWDQRLLCPDGGCIGVIGPEGTCKVCGRVAPNWGDERKRGLVETADDEGEPYGETADGADDDAAGGEPVEKPAPASRARKPAEWNERRLCSDGACIGVVGPDGTCKLCGRKAADAGDADEYDDTGYDDDGDPEDDLVASSEDDGFDDDADDDDADDADDDDEDDGDGDAPATSSDPASSGDAPATSSELARSAGSGDAPATSSGPAKSGELATPLGALEIEDEADRKLCPDGACVGIIGADGKCKVCGKEAA